MLDTTQITGARDIDATFSELTTLHVGGTPVQAIECSSESAAVEVLTHLKRVLIVGGGSNLLVADGVLDFTAVVFRMNRIEVTGNVVRAQAGATWDDVVAEAVERGLGGIECLSGIPGSAGATPVQNVGAYGAEIADRLTRVKILNFRSGQVEWVGPETLDLAYRSSNLKFTRRAAVLEVELTLTEDGLSAPLRFGQLTKHLGVSEGGERLPVGDVRDAVLELRRAKGMVYDPADHDTWSAGSFFTNPVVDVAVVDELEARGLEVPRYPATVGKVKLSAAWLIDKAAGFHPGYPGEGALARLSTKHSLALTNRGAATARDIADLAHEIQAGVKQATGVELKPEPVWVGFA